MNEELIDLHYSPIMVRVIRWRRMRLAEHAARMGERKSVYRAFVGGNLRERNYLEHPGRERTIILKWIFRKWVGGVGVYGMD